MAPQAQSWTCSACSLAWVLGATGTATITPDQAVNVIGYPNCINPTYGCMSSQCLIDAYAQYGLHAVEEWVSFDQAYAICSEHTGQINPTSMYHFMAIRGVDGANLWVANSAPGYDGVWDTLTRTQFNNLGPTKVIYLVD